jgi:thiamine-phosphate pyrophosphorylase
MLRYAITDRSLFDGDDAQKQAALIKQVAHWTDVGMDVIQLREKDLSSAQLAALARSILTIVSATVVVPSTRLLINSRADVAIAVGAHGIHLTSARGGLTAKQVRSLYSAAGLSAPWITASCHSPEQVARLRKEQGPGDGSDRSVDAILFAPVFGKVVAGEIVSPAQGLDQLHAACIAAGPIPVYALGGVTPENTAECLHAGASGIAGIRLFHDMNLHRKV